MLIRSWYFLSCLLYPVWVFIFWCMKLPLKHWGSLLLSFRAIQYLLISSRHMWSNFESMIKFVRSKYFSPVIDFFKGSNVNESKYKVVVLSFSCSQSSKCLRYHLVSSFLVLFLNFYLADKSWACFHCSWIHVSTFRPLVSFMVFSGHDVVPWCIDIFWGREPLRGYFVVLYMSIFLFSVFIFVRFLGCCICWGL